MPKLKAKTRRKGGKKAVRKAEDNVAKLVALLIVIIVACSYFGVSQDKTDIAVQFVIGLIIAAITAFVAEAILEAISGDLFKRFLLTLQFKVFGKRVRFSVTIFAIIAFVVEGYIFGFWWD